MGHIMGTPPLECLPMQSVCMCVYVFVGDSRQERQTECICEFARKMASHFQES